MKGTRKPRSLQYEPLESREVMTAGVTAALDLGGVLHVDGTDDADQLYFKQVKNIISINGVAGAWSTADVNSIVVDLVGGDDYVSLNSRGNGGNKVLKEQFSVHSGDGNVQVLLQNGKMAYFAGEDNTLDVQTDGMPLLNGAALNLTSKTITSFKSGVLTVTGTNAADSLKFLQTNGKISIKGVSGSWAAKDVKSIMVYLQDGHDYVSLDSLINGGKQTMNVAVTVKSGAGNESVRLANGHTVNFTGPKHTLTVAANGGTVKLDGQTLSWNNPTPPNPTPPNPTPPNPTPPNPTPNPSGNWFDTHVQDAALRSLGSSLYTDGLIDRNDMIAILRNLEDGGVVDATELTDLRSIAGTTSLFGSLDYVRKLTTYIATGSVANRYYQGQTLGGLGAGSTAATMENFIGKWFLGLDRPTAGGTYRQFAGQLFVNGATYQDIHQGSVGDCYFVASLAEIALKNPSAITSMFTVNGDGTYTVRFYNYGVAEYVTVDSYLPTNGGGGLIYATRGANYTNTGNELWVALAEKAYAQANEFGFTRAGFSDSGQNSYNAINGGYIFAALGHISGQSTAAFTMTGSSTSFNTFVTAYNAGKSIGFASYSTPQSSSVVGGHAYAVVGYNSSNQTVTFFNPWGTEYGLVTLTWAQVQQNFQYFDRTA